VYFKSFPQGSAAEQGVARGRTSPKSISGSCNNSSPIIQGELCTGVQSLPVTGGHGLCRSCLPAVRVGPDNA
jgi:hypothetical protein